MDVLEDAVIQNVVILQTVLDEVNMNNGSDREDVEGERGCGKLLGEDRWMWEREVVRNGEEGEVVGE